MQGGKGMSADEVIEFPPFRLDCRAGRLWRGTQAVPLRPKAWALLRHLAERPGVLVTKEELHPAVWGDTVVSDDTLTRTMAELRRALRDDARTPRFIETVHRRGFRFLARQPERAGEGLVPPAPSPDAPVLVGRDADSAALRAQLQQAKVGRRAV